MLQRHINSTHSSPPPQTLPHPAQVSFIFILLYSCFSGRCGTRTDIRLTNNAATAAKSGATSSPCSLSSLSLLPSVFIYSLSLSLFLSVCLARLMSGSQHLKLHLGGTAAMEKMLRPEQTVSNCPERVQNVSFSRVRVDSLSPSAI